MSTISHQQSERLRQVFCRILEMPADTHADALHRCRIQSWDSLTQVSLVTEIETELNTLFEAGEYAQIVSYDAALRILEAKALPQP